MGSETPEQFHERVAREMQHERETRMRPLVVRKPDGRDAVRSGGVVLEFELSPTTTTQVDTNPAEARAWAQSILRFLDDNALGLES